MAAQSLFTTEDSQRLTRVGPGSPMGELMRRYWMPVLLSEELPVGAPDPKPVRVLGEDLVAFRTKEGRIGLLDRYCPHRGASLAVGRVEDCGIRCLYHAFKIDCDGNVLETPAAPRDLVANPIKTLAYPTDEYGGIIWAYLGPNADAPARPKWPFLEAGEDAFQAVKLNSPTNWLRILEGENDAAHASYLHYTRHKHTHDMSHNVNSAKILFDPQAETWENGRPWGIQNILRFRLEEPKFASFWLREYLVPFFGVSGQDVDGLPAEGPNSSNFQSLGRGRFAAYIPVDDFNTNMYLIYWRKGAALTRRDLEFIDDDVYATSGVPENGYRSAVWVEGKGYEQDRAAMHRGDSWSGFTGVTPQDHALQYEMPREMDLSMEHLGGEDKLVIAIRQLLLEAMLNVENGGEVPAIDWESISYRYTTALTDTPYEEVVAHPEWADAFVPAASDWEPAVDAWSALPKG
jgi:phthalate 4,5-dioxygenase